MRRVWKPVAMTLLLMVTSTVTVGAQAQTGTIVGRVSDRASRTPISGATINAVGSVLSTRTLEDGRFRLSGLRVGQLLVRATRLGYSAEAKTVTVVAGQETTVDFDLAQSAIQIDEVLVTATGEEQRKRESGNSVSSVSVTPEALSNVTTLSQLLTAKAPGLYVNSPGGTTGSAARIRIRGANSVSLTNEPLLVIDGVRANNDIGGRTNDGTLGVGGQMSSRFNDLNPDDIESIEVLKGPAASALYGTAAANGVIQIRTKRGRAGKTRWTTYSEAGSQADQTTYPANFTQVGTNTAGARITGCTLDAQTRLACTPNPDSLVSFNPLEDPRSRPFVTGYRTSFGASAAGGGDVANYFVSSDVDRDQGVFEPNHLYRVSLRANLSGQLRNNVTTSFFSNYSSSRLEFPQNDNNILGVISSGLLGSAFYDTVSRGYLAGQSPQQVYAIDTRENVERFIGSNLTTWQALPWLSATLQSGVDFIDRRNKATTPPNKVFFSPATTEGSRNSNAAQLWTYTANGTLTGIRDINTDFRSTTTAGVQYTREVFQGTRAFGAKLLAGTGSLQGTAARFAVGETNTDNRTLGALIQEQVAWRDRLFATAAVRTDNNSAFGAKFGWVKYPAASLSWVVSEEPFFPQSNLVSSLRLRTAYGESGQRPNFRDAITYYETQTVTTAAGDLPGVVVGGTGNPNLKPEHSREYEIGFEMGLLQNRASLDVSAYSKRTNDLLIAMPLPPSLGLTQTQFRNLGESSNRGIEMVLTGKVFEVSKARLDVSVSASSNRNRLEKLGLLPSGAPIPPVIFGIQRHKEGYPLGSYWDEGYTFSDKNNDGIISRLNCPGQAQLPGGPECELLMDPTSSPKFLGNPLPTKEATFSPRLTLFQDLEVGSLFDYRGGFKQFNNTYRFRCNFGNCEEAYNKNMPLDQQARNIAHLMGSDAGYVEDADYIKLREVTVSYVVPRRWVTRARASEARLTFAASNLKTWTDYTGFDPEVNSTPANLFSNSDFLTQPPLRVYSARLTLSF
ncbi:MAG TPA: SusC/RagA family TonB-linked outer membrane protein [Gemmatimonadaceae bacterium]|nr:SusC/RagA family TonB-linked outer membrane protein [Gemmatimonadaceae bacterium]